ncbi:MAG: glutamine--tRNA ligase/YqeY domain fusion protein, partial [Deltaproteobacteria bacterium]
MSENKKNTNSVDAVDANTTEEAARSNFIRTMIDEDLESNKYGGRVVTRFPPEPNGYLHIGHSKSICLNFGLAESYNGVCHLRFDDTNPASEDMEYVESIKRDVKWLGFDWGDKLFFASDYFERLYEFAVELIKKDLAYVDSLNEEEIREYRGTVKEDGKPSPYRTRSLEENLDLFERMKKGEFEDGDHVLRAKIDLSSPNMKMRDPLLYRIRKNDEHYRRGHDWCIYPMYDFAHCLSDAMEGITHSLCTLEFENNRELYDWILANVELEVNPPPEQTEFARLKLSYTVMSKRKLLRLVKENHVSGWDDPRMPTVAGMRRRGYSPEAIRDLAERVGVAKANSVVDFGMLEFSVRNDLNFTAPRVLCVMDPIKVVLENYPEDKVEELEAPYYPEEIPKEGSRMIPLTREVYIERSDFEENPPKGFRRLSPGNEVRLRYGYVIKCDEVIKDDDGNVVELRCSYDPDTLGKAPEGRKVKGAI